MGGMVKSVFLSDHAPVVFVTYVVKYSYKIPLTIDLTSTRIITQTVFALMEQVLHHSSENQNPFIKQTGSLAAWSLSVGEFYWENFDKWKLCGLETPLREWKGREGEGCGAESGYFSSAVHAVQKGIRQTLSVTFSWWQQTDVVTSPSSTSSGGRGPEQLQASTHEVSECGGSLAPAEPLQCCHDWTALWPQWGCLHGFTPLRDFWLGSLPIQAQCSLGEAVRSAFRTEVLSPRWTSKSDG